MAEPVVALGVLEAGAVLAAVPAAAVVGGQRRNDSTADGSGHPCASKVRRTSGRLGHGDGRHLPMGRP